MVAGILVLSLAVDVLLTILLSKILNRGQSTVFLIGTLMFIVLAIIGLVLKSGVAVAFLIVAGGFFGWYLFYLRQR